MRVWSRGLGRVELAADLKKVRIIYDGKSMYLTGKTEAPLGWDFVVVIDSTELWPMAKLVSNGKGLKFLSRWLKLRLFDHKALKEGYNKATKTRSGVKPDIEYAQIIQTSGRTTASAEKKLDTSSASSLSSPVQLAASRVSDRKQQLNLNAGPQVVIAERVGQFPFPMSDALTRKTNFSEVQQSYSMKQSMEEAKRCLLCATPVCIDACPVQMDIRGMCEAVSRGDFKTAYTRIRETNDLAGVTARCCPTMHGLCEDACVVTHSVQGGQPVSIAMIQRFVSDWERKELRQQNPRSGAKTGKRVAIVGSGPAGLAAASLLRRYGHGVTIYEEMATTGGTARYGIPDFHLPKDVLEYEVGRIKAQGVDIKTGMKVGKDITIAEILSDFADVVLITTGPKDVAKMNAEGIDMDGIYDGYSFLEAVYANGVESYLKSPTFDLGKDIVVIGGGDTALDDARTALRLTQGRVTVVYRRTETEMPIDKIMLQQAKEEGVQFKFLAEPTSFKGEEGKITSVLMKTMKLGEPDSTGRRRPETVVGEEFTMKCSSVLLAIGRGPNSFLPKQAGLKTGLKNCVQVDDHFKTSIPHVFAAGDVISGETLVVKAMASGREAAQRVHEFLMNMEDNHVSLYDRYYVSRILDMPSNSSNGTSGSR